MNERRRLQNPLLAWALPLLISLLLLVPFSHAARDLGDFAVGLPGHVDVGNQTLTVSPQLIHVNATLENTGGVDWVVYLLSNQNDIWRNERVLGVLQPGTRQTLQLDFEARYTGQRFARTQYALVATGNAVPLGRYFWLEENWSYYEDEANRQVSTSALVVVPVVALGVMGLLIILAEMAYVSRAGGQFSGEYTMRSFFLPVTDGRPPKELVADFMSHPLMWVLEMAAIGVMAYLIWNGLGAREAAIGPLPMILLSLAAALSVPLVYFSLVWFFNQKVEQMPLRFFAGAFLWGAAGATISLFVNTFYGQTLHTLFGLDAAGVTLLTTAMMAPLVEEIVKGLGLLALFGHHEFSDALHGLLLGFSVGLGFSFVENWFYFASKTAPLELGLAAWAGLVAYRALFNSISHGCFSATLGASLGWAKSRGWGEMARLAFIPGVLTAIVMHSLFNITAILDGFTALSTQYMVYSFNPKMVLTLLGITVLVLLGAIKDHQKRTTRENRKASMPNIRMGEPQEEEDV